MFSPSQKLHHLQEVQVDIFNLMMLEHSYGDSNGAFLRHLERAMAELKIAEEILIAESFASGAMAWFDTSDEGLINGNPDSEALA